MLYSLALRSVWTLVIFILRHTIFIADSTDAKFVYSNILQKQTVSNHTILSFGYHD